MINLLLSIKLDINFRDNNKRTTLYVALRRLEDIRYMNLLISHNADFNIQNNLGYRSLYNSVYFNVATSIHFLLNKDANINAANNYRQDSLMLAVVYNSYNVLRLLLREETLKYDKKIENGRFVLNFATQYSDIKIIRLLESSSRIKIVDLNSDYVLNSTK